MRCSSKDEGTGSKGRPERNTLTYLCVGVCVCVCVFTSLYLRVDGRRDSLEQTARAPRITARAHKGYIIKASRGLCGDHISLPPLITKLQLQDEQQTLLSPAPYGVSCSLAADPHGRLDRCSVPSHRLPAASGASWRPGGRVGLFQRRRRQCGRAVYWIHSSLFHVSQLKQPCNSDVWEHSGCRPCPGDGER